METCLLTIVPRQKDAEVTIIYNGVKYSGSSLEVNKGSLVTTIVQSPGYISEEKTIRVETPKTLFIDLKENYCTFTISTFPENCTVSINGESITKTENTDGSIIYTKDIANGSKVTWSVEKTGYVTLEGVFTIKEDTDRYITLFDTDTSSTTTTTLYKVGKANDDENRIYGVQADSKNRLYVKVPWISGLTTEDSELSNHYKSIVFCRSDKTPKKPYGIKSYESGLPTSTTGSGASVTWYDSVPMNSSELIWMSSAFIYYNEEDYGSSRKPIWSTPSVLSDSDKLDIEFSFLDSKPSIQSKGTTEDELSAYNSWYAAQTIWVDSTKVNEYEEDYPEGPKWMAMCTSDDGGLTWKDWVISRIRGEAGDPSFLSTDNSTIYLDDDTKTLEDLRNSTETKLIFRDSGVVTDPDTLLFAIEENLDEYIQIQDDIYLLAFLNKNVGYLAFAKKVDDTFIELTSAEVLALDLPENCIEDGSYSVTYKVWEDSEADAYLLKLTIIVKEVGLVASHKLIISPNTLSYDGDHESYLLDGEDFIKVYVQLIGNKSVTTVADDLVVYCTSNPTNTLSDHYYVICTPTDSTVDIEVNYNNSNKSFYNFPYQTLGYDITLYFGGIGEDYIVDTLHINCASDGKTGAGGFSLVASNSTILLDDDSVGDSTLANASAIEITAYKGDSEVSSSDVEYSFEYSTDDIWSNNFKSAKAVTSNTFLLVKGDSITKYTQGNTYFIIVGTFYASNSTHSPANIIGKAKKRININIELFSNGETYNILATPLSIIYSSEGKLVDGNNYKPTIEISVIGGSEDRANINIIENSADETTLEDSELYLYLLQTGTDTIIPMEYVFNSDKTKIRPEENLSYNELGYDIYLRIGKRAYASDIQHLNCLKTGGVSFTINSDNPAAVIDDTALATTVHANILGATKNVLTVLLGLTDVTTDTDINYRIDSTRTSLPKIYVNGEVYTDSTITIACNTLDATNSLTSADPTVCSTKSIFYVNFPTLSYDATIEKGNFYYTVNVYKGTLLIGSKKFNFAVSDISPDGSAYSLVIKNYKWTYNTSGSNTNSTSNCDISIVKYLNGGPTEISKDNWDIVTTTPSTADDAFHVFIPSTLKSYFLKNSNYRLTIPTEYTSTISDGFELLLYYGNVLVDYAEINVVKQVKDGTDVYSILWNRDSILIDDLTSGETLYNSSLVNATITKSSTSVTDYYFDLTDETSDNKPDFLYKKAEAAYWLKISANLYIVTDTNRQNCWLEKTNTSNIDTTNGKFTTSFSMNVTKNDNSEIICSRTFNILVWEGMSNNGDTLSLDITEPTFFNNNTDSTPLKARVLVVSNDLSKATSLKDISLYSSSLSNGSFYISVFDLVDGGLLSRETGKTDVSDDSEKITDADAVSENEYSLTVPYKALGYRVELRYKASDTEDWLLLYKTCTPVATDFDYTKDTEGHYVYGKCDYSIDISKMFATIKAEYYSDRNIKILLPILRGSGFFTDTTAVTFSSSFGKHVKLYIYLGKDYIAGTSTGTASNVIGDDNCAYVVDGTSSPYIIPKTYLPVISWGNYLKGTVYINTTDSSAYTTNSWVLYNFTRQGTDGYYFGADESGTLSFHSLGNSMTSIIQSNTEIKNSVSKGIPVNLVANSDFADVTVSGTDLLVDSKKSNWTIESNTTSAKTDLTSNSNAFYKSLQRKLAINASNTSECGIETLTREDLISGLTYTFILWLYSDNAPTININITDANNISSKVYHTDIIDKNYDKDIWTLSKSPNSTSNTCEQGNNKIVVTFTNNYVGKPTVKITGNTSFDIYRCLLCIGDSELPWSDDVISLTSYIDLTATNIAASVSENVGLSIDEDVTYLANGNAGFVAKNNTSYTNNAGVTSYYQDGTSISAGEGYLAGGNFTWDSAGTIDMTGALTSTSFLVKANLEDTDDTQFDTSLATYLSNGTITKTSSLYKLLTKTNITMCITTWKEVKAINSIIGTNSSISVTDSSPVFVIKSYDSNGAASFFVLNPLLLSNGDSEYYSFAFRSFTKLACQKTNGNSVSSLSATNVYKLNVYDGYVGNIITWKSGKQCSAEGCLAAATYHDKDCLKYVTLPHYMLTIDGLTIYCSYINNTWTINELNDRYTKPTDVSGLSLNNSLSSIINDTTNYYLITLSGYSDVPYFYRYGNKYYKSLYNAGTVLSINTIINGLINCLGYILQIALGNSTLYGFPSASSWDLTDTTSANLLASKVVAQDSYTIGTNNKFKTISEIENYYNLCQNWKNDKTLTLA